MACLTKTKHISQDEKIPNYLHELYHTWLMHSKTTGILKCKKRND